jgi:acetyltransferase-like isoleucine patch superfamily enzyme
LPIKDQPLLNKTTIIGCGSWIGINSVILPGVTIGKNVVVGANSLVKNDVPDFCIVAGTPAKIIKKIS